MAGSQNNTDILELMRQMTAGDEVRSPSGEWTPDGPDPVLTFIEASQVRNAEDAIADLDAQMREMTADFQMQIGALHEKLIGERCKIAVVKAKAADRQGLSRDTTTIDHQSAPQLTDQTGMGAMDTPRQGERLPVAEIDADARAPQKTRPLSRMFRRG